MVALTCIFGTSNINKDHVKKKSKKLEIRKREHSERSAKKV